MKQEFARFPDRPATFTDISEVFAAIEDLAREVSITNEQTIDFRFTAI